MQETSRQAFEEWRAAEGDARQVEARLAQAWQLYFARQAPAPANELFIEVTRARTTANERLSHAMARMRAQLKPGHPR
jgi:hypothetical protein